MLEIVATAVFDDDQVTCPVRSCIEPSEKVPMAMNCSVLPGSTLELALAGITMIELRVGAGVTVSRVEPVTPFIVAEIDEVPTVTPVATPAALMVATAGVAEAQVTRPVMSCVVLLEKVPMAVNGSVAPTAMLGVAGVTAIDWRVAALTVSTVEPVTPLSVAEIVEVPAATPVATPAALMVATAGVGRSPSHLAGDVLRRVVRERTRGRERLGGPGHDAGIGRCHRDRGQGRRGACTVMVPDMPVAVPLTSTVNGAEVSERSCMSECVIERETGIHGHRNPSDSACPRPRSCCESPGRRPSGSCRRRGSWDRRSAVPGDCTEIEIENVDRHGGQERADLQRFCPVTGRQPGLASLGAVSTRRDAEAPFER